MVLAMQIESPTAAVPTALSVIATFLAMCDTMATDTRPTDFDTLMRRIAEADTAAGDFPGQTPDGGAAAAADIDTGSFSDTGVTTAATAEAPAQSPPTQDAQPGSAPAAHCGETAQPLTVPGQQSSLEAHPASTAAATGAPTAQTQPRSESPPSPGELANGAAGAPASDEPLYGFPQFDTVDDASDHRFYSRTEPAQNPR